jgi:hypothetical protein
MSGVWCREVLVGQGRCFVGGLYRLLQWNVYQAHQYWNDSVSAVQWEFNVVAAKCSVQRVWKRIQSIGVQLGV